MNLREHIASLHHNLNDLRGLAERIDAELNVRAQRSNDHYAPIRRPGASLTGLSVILHDEPLLCGARESWHTYWRETVENSKEAIAMALPAEYDKRYAALQLACELELEVTSSSLKKRGTDKEPSPQVAEHLPPDNRY